MYRYSRSSLNHLKTCRYEHQHLFTNVLKYFDHTIIQGHRTAQQHKQYLLEGKTKVSYQRSKHSPNPSNAVDVAPYPIRWKDYRGFYVFAGVVMAVAEDLNYSDHLRWGGDWDRDGRYDDQTFYDLVHWEWID